MLIQTSWRTKSPSHACFTRDPEVVKELILILGTCEEGKSAEADETYIDTVTGAVLVHADRNNWVAVGYEEDGADLQRLFKRLKAAESIRSGIHLLERAEDKESGFDVHYGLRRRVVLSD